MAISNVHLRWEDEILTRQQTHLHAYAVLLRQIFVQNIKRTSNNVSERVSKQIQVHQQFGVHGLSIYARLRAVAVDCASVATVKESMRKIFSANAHLRGTVLEPLNLDLKAHYTRPEDLEDARKAFQCQFEFTIGSDKGKKQGEILYDVLCRSKN